MVLHVVRVLFLLVVVAITLSYAFQPPVVEQEYTTWRFLSVSAYILLPALGAFALILVDMFWRRKRLDALSGLFFGLLAGMVIAWALAKVIDIVVPVYPALQDVVLVQLVKALLGVAAVFICVSFVLQTKDDFRFVIPYVEFSRQAKGPRPILLDTSAIIDGRIADIADTRILDAEIVIPRFILAELQGIADSGDKLKRNRGRRGLDVLNRLRADEKLDIRIVEPTASSVIDVPKVDAKLVAMAKRMDGRIVTNDYNLNKIAQLQDVTVINVNDLANALKPIVLPGEAVQVKVIKPGEESGQGVGYLEDGTMVVVEGGRSHVGHDVQITVTSVLQTSAGRMIFGQLRRERAPAAGPSS